MPYPPGRKLRGWLSDGRRDRQLSFLSRGPDPGSLVPCMTLFKTILRLALVSASVALGCAPPEPGGPKDAGPGGGGAAGASSSGAGGLRAGGGVSGTAGVSGAGGGPASG